MTSKPVVLLLSNLGLAKPHSPLLRSSGLRIKNCDETSWIYSNDTNMRASFFHLTSILILGAPLPAQSPKQLVLAHQLLDVMEFEKSEMRRRERVPPGQTEAERRTTVAGTQFLNKHLSPEKLREPLAGAYASLFSESELLELIAFYDSRAGKKLSSLQMELANAMQEVVSQVFRDHLEEYSRTVLQIPIPPPIPNRPMP